MHTEEERKKSKKVLSIFDMSIVFIKQLGLSLLRLFSRLFWISSIWYFNANDSIISITVFRLCIYDEYSEANWLWSVAPSLNADWQLVSLHLRPEYQVLDVCSTFSGANFRSQEFFGWHIFNITGRYILCYAFVSARKFLNSPTLISLSFSRRRSICTVMFIV